MKVASVDEFEDLRESEGELNKQKEPKECGCEFRKSEVNSQEEKECRASLREQSVKSRCKLEEVRKKEELAEAALILNSFH